MVKTINIILEDKEHALLSEQKGMKTWKEFFISGVKR